MALISEVKELFKQVEINNSSRKSDEDFIKYAFEKATACDEVIPSITGYLDTKNETTSAIKLQMAIKMSKDKKAPLEKIISCFNQSVAYGLHKSDILTKAYINRHMFLVDMCMYEEALKDIESALLIAVSEELRVDLNIKKIKVLLALNNGEEASFLMNDTFNLLYSSKMKESSQIRYEVEMVKLSLELGYCLGYAESLPPGKKQESFSNLRPNQFQPVVLQRDNFKFIPIEDDVKKCSFKSSKISLNYLYDLGYHLVAQEDIKAGEPLLVDPVYEKVIKFKERYLRCWNCTKFCWSCIPCHMCANVIFCSTPCRNEAFRKHLIECQIINVLLNHRNFYHEQSLLSLRLFIRAFNELKNLESLKCYVETIKTECKSAELVIGGIQSDKSIGYRHFYCMSRDPMDKKSKDKHSFAAVYYTYCLAATTGIFGKKITDCKELMNHPLALFVAELLFHHAMLIDTHMIPLRQRTLCENARIYGGAIMPSVSLCSNDDRPNSYQFFNHNKIVLTSMVNIKKGEIIRTNFGLNYLKMLTTKERDILLKKPKFGKQYESCLPNQNSGTIYSPCWNHFKNHVDYNDIRGFLNELSISNLVRWSSNQLEKVPEERILTIIKSLFQFIGEHNEIEISCISVEAVKLFLYHIYDFIDSYEL
ncbi:SET and MYND domain-containing protein 4-like [Cotesia glomerata]|nr:SET and MYND domain-containing protein 4-like [Cotesia glomerata]XP_044578139.1 SET and MYND domain-containing protein 4-like [Cotesia glomerata]